MQDPLGFFRQRALAAFHRRSLYPILSEDWRHTVDEARRFVNTYRALQARPELDALDPEQPAEGPDCKTA